MDTIHNSDSPAPVIPALMYKATLTPSLGFSIYDVGNGPGYTYWLHWGSYGRCEPSRSPCLLHRISVGETGFCASPPCFV